MFSIVSTPPHLRGQSLSENIPLKSILTPLSVRVLSVKMVGQIQLLSQEGGLGINLLMQHLNSP